MDPLLLVLGIAVAACAFCWIASLVSGDVSWVDRLWSILPAVYVLVFAAGAGFADARLDLMAGLAVLWAARLTFNFARRGGYSGYEDYRWGILRTRMSRPAFAVFNLLFIVLFQNAVLVLISLPALTAYEHRGVPLGPLDIVLAALFLIFLAGETIADQQQWSFQRGKKRELEAGREPAARFATTGLWRYSRHPNYFFEQAQWWAMFFLGAASAGSVLQWTVLGVLLLTAVFIGSTTMTEGITRSRYPEYAEYQRMTSPIVPWPPRRVRAAQPG